MKTPLGIVTPRSSVLSAFGHRACPKVLQDLRDPHDPSRGNGLGGAEIPALEAGDT